MNKVINAIKGIGVMAFLVGAAGMDSEQLIYPIALMAAGAVVVWITEQICPTEMD